MNERQIHEAFNVFLRERQIPFVESRMDRKSTIAKSWPDYTLCWCSKVLLIEVKTARGRLRPDQVKMIEYIRRSGNRVEVCRSVPECIEAAQSILCEGKPAERVPGACAWPLEGCFREMRMAVMKAGTPGEVFDEGMLEEREGTPPVNGKPLDHLFIGYIGDTPKVFHGGGASGGLATMLRTATATDLATLPRK